MHSRKGGVVSRIYLDLYGIMRASSRFVTSYKLHHLFDIMDRLTRVVQELANYSTALFICAIVAIFCKTVYMISQVVVDSISSDVQYTYNTETRTDDQLSKKKKVIDCSLIWNQTFDDMIPLMKDAGASEELVTLKRAQCIEALNSRYQDLFYGSAVEDTIRSIKSNLDEIIDKNNKNQEQHTSFILTIGQTGTGKTSFSTLVESTSYSKLTNSHILLMVRELRLTSSSKQRGILLLRRLLNDESVSAAQGAELFCDQIKSMQREVAITAKSENKDEALLVVTVNESESLFKGDALNVILVRLEQLKIAKMTELLGVKVHTIVSCSTNEFRFNGELRGKGGAIDRRAQVVQCPSLGQFMSGIVLFKALEYALLKNRLYVLPEVDNLYSTSSEYDNSLQIAKALHDIYLHSLTKTHFVKHTIPNELNKNYGPCYLEIQEIEKDSISAQKKRLTEKFCDSNFIYSRKDGACEVSMTFNDQEKFLQKLNEYFRYLYQQKLTKDEILRSITELSTKMSNEKSLTNMVALADKKMSDLVNDESGDIKELFEHVILSSISAASKSTAYRLDSNR